MVLGCTTTQLITEFHEWLCAHNGVDRTLAILTQKHPRDTEAEAWPNLRHDVREYVLSCATCQKMDNRHKAIRAKIRSFHATTNETLCARHDRAP